MPLVSHRLPQAEQQIASKVPARHSLPAMDQWMLGAKGNNRQADCKSNFYDKQAGMCPGLCNDSEQVIDTRKAALLSTAHSRD